jgi:antitoxin (DNA-binding transcriptional repressor) of toxin-antitoxin stability system
MMIANVHEAKSQLSKLLDAVERGEEVVITRRGSGTNRFLLIAEPVPGRKPLFGALKDELAEWTEAAMEEADRYLEEIMEESLNAPLFPGEE